MRKYSILSDITRFNDLVFNIQDCNGWLYVRMSSPLWYVLQSFFLGFDLTAFSPSQNGRLVHFRLYDISLDEFYQLLKEYYE